MVYTKVGLSVYYVPFHSLLFSRDNVSYEVWGVCVLNSPGLNIPIALACGAAYFGVTICVPLDWVGGRTATSVVSRAFSWQWTRCGLHLGYSYEAIIVRWIA